MSDETVNTGWGEPVKTGRRPGVLVRWLAELRARPGSWGWRDYSRRSSAATTCTTIRRAGFDATVRGARLYARWPEAKRDAT